MITEIIFEKILIKRISFLVLTFCVQVTVRNQQTRLSTANDEFATQEVVTQSVLQICCMLLSPDKDFKCTLTSNNGTIQELFMNKSPKILTVLLRSMTDDLNRGETPTSCSRQLSVEMCAFI